MLSYDVRQDSSLEDEKAKKEDRPSSSLRSTHSVTVQMKKEPGEWPLKAEKTRQAGSI